MRCLLFPLAVWPVCAKDAFVFLGATGDNALRPSGVWQGVFEAYAGGVFDKVGGVDIHVAMNTPHSEDELQTKVLSSLKPLYEELQGKSSWKCKTQDGDCSPDRFVNSITVNIWEGRDANEQAANMAPSLATYGRITLYLSIPPSIFGPWSKAAVDNWGLERVHVAAEKPFGTSLADADKLHAGLLHAGVPESSLHLVDHWLSFFMNRNLPLLRSIAGVKLGIDLDRSSIEKVVVTQFEERGLDGRGGFFDGVGQVRDMVQSHLLQVLVLSMVEAASGEDLSAAKLRALSEIAIGGCVLGQYDGFLLEPKLSYHPSFADATLCEVSLLSSQDKWYDVELHINTGKAIGSTLYTVDFYQRGGPGILTFEIGKEETGVGGIKVHKWPLHDESAFDAPAPGFGAQAPIRAEPSVVEGDGYILEYSDPQLYFPKPYALMAAALLTRDYGAAFVTYPECQRSWEIVAGSSATLCLDPSPGRVRVYKPRTACHDAPSEDVCWEPDTVQDLYGAKFSCTAEHDLAYANVSFYQAKCHGPGEVIVV